jgi:hypothetical protein
VPPAGRARQPVPSAAPRPAADVLAALLWRRVTWRRGTQEALAARFAALRVRVADGPVGGNNRPLPGEQAWRVGEGRASGERTYYLSNLAPRTPLRALAAAIKARWVCEQAHQQLKRERGLGHFEGGSWTGLHRHALMRCIAFAYPAGQGGEKPGPANPGYRRSPAWPPCAKPSSADCSHLSCRRHAVRTASRSASYRLNTKCPGSTRRRATAGVTRSSGRVIAKTDLPCQRATLAMMWAAAPKPYRPRALPLPLSPRDRQPIRPAQSSGANAASSPVSPSGKANRASAITAVANPPFRVNPVKSGRSHKFSRCALQ